MSPRSQVPGGQILMDRDSRAVVGHGGLGGVHVSDQVRDLPLSLLCLIRGVLAGLGQVQLVAEPEQLLAFGRPARVGVIRAGQTLLGWRHPVTVGAPPHHLPPTRVGLDQERLAQHPAQDRGLRQLAQPGELAALCVDRAQQHPPVAAVLKRQRVALGCGARLAPGRDRRAVPRGPRLKVYRLGQEPRGDRGQRLRQCPHCFAGQLHRVQVTHCGDHVRGVRALFAPGLDQPELSAALQQPVEGEPGQIIADQPGPKFCQHTVIETRIIQLEAQRVFPVDPPRHRGHRLPIRQPLHELQNRDQHQQRRRDPRPAPHPERVNKIIILE